MVESNSCPIFLTKEQSFFFIYFLSRSVGCLLYEMCTFKHAFDGKGLMNVIYQVVEGKPPQLPNNYSKELNDILKKFVPT